jgi:hypothetical protein
VLSVRLTLRRPGRRVKMQRDRFANVTRQENDVLVTHDLMTPEKNLQRIMWTGTLWFGAAVGTIAVVLGLLLSSGWRPAVLTGGLQIVWWIGSFLVALSIGLIGWSGCPVLEVSVPIADRNKTRTMQLGTLLYIVGGAVALFAVLLGPAR